MKEKDLIRFMDRMIEERKAIIASQFLLYDCNIFCPKKQLDSLIIFGLKLYNIYS